MEPKPYQSPATSEVVIAEGGSRSVDEIVGEPVLARIWFRTKHLPWHRRYVGLGYAFEFFLLLACFAFEYFGPKRKTETESLLGYSGRVYCARTQGHLVFIAHQEEVGQANRLLRRIPATEVRSCENSISTAVKFQFDSGESLVLYFEGERSKLSDFVKTTVEATQG